MAPAPVIRLHPDDGVLIARSSIPSGTVVADGVTTVERIPAGHKVGSADRDVASRSPLRQIRLDIGRNPGHDRNLVAAGMRSTVVTPSATTVPDGMLERAISTPSSGCSRMTGAGAMCVSLCLTNGPYPEEQCSLGLEGWPQCSMPSCFETAFQASQHEALYTDQLRLAVRILAGLRNLHLGVGRHQSAFVRHVTSLKPMLIASPHQPRHCSECQKNTALAAFLYELFVDSHDLGLFTIELRHKTVGEAEVDGPT